MKIYNIYGAEIYSSEKETIKEALEEAVKNKADLRLANLSSADLRSANLRSANLSSANLRLADLSSADLSKTQIPLYCKWSVAIIDGKIKIGCKTNSIEVWDAFFTSTEIFETERNTPEFIRIEANYLAAKAYLQHLKLNKL